MSKHAMMMSNNGILKLKVVIKKLQKSLLVLTKRDWEEETELPEDVKEGHFVVMATGGEELKRFVVPMSYLTNPPFLRLLEQAAEEYGFNCGGALAVPCRPAKLEKILAEQWGSYSLV